MIDKTTGLPEIQEFSGKPLSRREWQLADLLYRARFALWREWAETGSVEAKVAFETTDPKGLS